MMEKQTKKISPKLTRRSLLKLGAISCSACLLDNSFGSLFKQEAHATEFPRADTGHYIYTVCANNCGSTCVLKARVEDDKVVRIETDNDVADDWENGIFQVRACPRGRTMRRHMYAQTRLKYPLKRVGKRGEGKFERISWDEALDLIAKRLRDCIDKYGNSAIMNVNASGVTTGPLTRRETAWRFFNTIGGITIGMRDFSSAQNQAALSYFYGKPGYSGNPITDIVHTKLAVFFGANFIETRMSGGGLQYELLEAKRKGNARIIVIDPRFSDTCASVADEWIAIRPGTDAALASAIAYQLIQEKMLDKDFLANYTSGFETASMPDGAPEASSYSDYILGTGYDKIAKTPQWASVITGIPAQRIIQLAREIGMAKPCYITQGWGVQRQAAGEMTTISIAALACLTGNMGIRGGGNGDYDAYYPFPIPKMPTGTNPVKVTFPTFLWVKAIEDGKNMTADRDGVTGADRFPTDIKFLWNYAGNHPMNQHSDINNTKRVLSDESKCETIVMMDTHMTASAKWADILLPSCVYPEQTDIQGPSYAMNTDWLLVTGEVKPFFESRPLYDVMCDLAKRMGTEEAFTEGKDREAWIEHLYQNNCRPLWPELPATAAEARSLGIQRRKKSRDLPVPFADFRKDPVANPLATPSGKVELFSTKLYELSKTWKLSDKKGDVICPTPQYVATWDGYEDYKTKEKYPLQMIGHHYKGRAHSHYANVDWLLEVSPQNLWINPIDAEARGIRHGDLVKVFNDRGIVHIPAKVTQRIMPGVVSLPQGAWHTPDANGIDTGGCVNTLTKYYPSPLAKGNPQHTNLVEVTRL